MVDLKTNSWLANRPRCQVLIEPWRWRYNILKTRGLLGYHPPAPDYTILASQRRNKHQALVVATFQGFHSPTVTEQTVNVPRRDSMSPSGFAARNGIAT